MRSSEVSAHEQLKETGYRVQPGFSGTPVWDDDLEGVVGMVVAAEARAEIRAAFTIPTDVLLESWPEMDQLAPLPCPYEGLCASSSSTPPTSLAERDSRTS